MSNEESSIDINLGTKGYVVEMFSSFQGEGGSVKGSCFGKRQIFVRLAGCELKCIWCDSADSRNPLYPECRIENEPGTWEFTTHSNPVGVDFVIDNIIKLRTKDFHSVSLTGGEPAHQKDFFFSLVNRLYDLGLPVFLETNGYYPERYAEIASLVSFACVDIKDRSAQSVKNSNWEKLVNNEFESMSILKNNLVEVFAKLVVTETTKLDDVRMYADRLRELIVPLAIQPVTPLGGVKPISNQKLFKIIETVAEVLPNDLFGLSIQGHKMVNLL